MSENIMKLWSKLSVSNSEKVGVVVSDINIAQTLLKGQHCLLGKILSDRHQLGSCQPNQVQRVEVYV